MGVCIGGGSEGAGEVVVCVFVGVRQRSSRAVAATVRLPSALVHFCCKARACTDLSLLFSTEPPGSLLDPLSLHPFLLFPLCQSLAGACRARTSLA